MSTFLNAEELAELTGRKLKSLQIAWLRRSGITFYVNASGHPVVPRSAIEGTRISGEPPRQPWVPKVLRDR